MHTLTMNMFAETNEDMPIISGAGRTELTEEPATPPTQGEWSPDGMDGYCNGFSIHITATTGWDDGHVLYRAEVWNDRIHLKHYYDTLDLAQRMSICHCVPTKADMQKKLI